MPRAREKARHTGILLNLSILIITACVLHPSIGNATFADGLAPTLSGEPVWGDGSRCVPLPDATAPLSYRFQIPDDLELDGIFVKLPTPRRHPARVYMELRDDVGGHPGDEVLGIQEADLPPGKQWLYISVGQLMLTAGDSFHLVFRTADTNTGKGRVCYLWHEEEGAPADYPWSALQLIGDSWVPVPTDYGWLEPVFVMSFTDGTVWGQPYWNIRSGRREALFGFRDIEMRIEASPVELTWLSARVTPRDQNAVLRYQLYSSKGEHIREGSLYPAEAQAPWPIGYGGPIDPPLEPNSDEFYVLVVNAPEARTPGQGFRQYRPITDFTSELVPTTPAALLAETASIPKDKKKGGGSGQSDGASVFVSTVSKPYCGNGKVDQLKERCDPNDDSVCPCNCKSDCTCGTNYYSRNVAPQAEVTASSEDNSAGAHDRGAVDNTIDGVPGNPAREWVSKGEGAGAWLRLDWASVQRVNRVVLHDRVSTTENITSATLVLPGREIPIGVLPTDGRALDIPFSTQELKTLTLKIKTASGTAVGLAEIEVVRTSSDVQFKPGNTTTTTSTSSTSTSTVGGGGGSTTSTTKPPVQTTSTTSTSSTTSSTILDPGTDDPEPLGRVFYISPGGSDASSGTSRDAAWKTFARAFNSSKTLQPGDTLVLLDGTYTRGTTGLVRIDCKSTGNANNGSSGEPITIKADHERKAALISDGTQAPFEMANCSWWRIEGLRAQDADNSSGSQSAGYPFRLHEVRYVTGKRLLGSHNNRKFNTHIYAVENSEQVTLEECEAYFFHRHAFSIWRSRGITLRRNYANSMLYGTKGCCSTVDNRDYGDEAVSVYGTSDSIIENCISENEANGYQIHGIASPLDPSGNGGRNNRVLGSISFEDTVPSLVSSRSSGPDSYHNAHGNLFRDFVAANMKGHGLYFRGTFGTKVENATVISSRSNSGLVADNGASGQGGTCSTSLVCTGTGASCSSNSDCSSGVCTKNPEGCSFSAVDVLAVNNASYGINSDNNQPMVEYSNSAGNSSNYGIKETINDGSGSVRNSLSTTPTKIGLATGSCVLWVPAGSNMKGAGKSGSDIGANILYRYENGQPTTKPLWNPTTGQFPCGAIVPGINDGAKRCSNINERMNVNRNGCLFPAGYGG